MEFSTIKFHLFAITLSYSNLEEEINRISFFIKFQHPNSTEFTILPSLQALNTIVNSIEFTQPTLLLLTIKYYEVYFYIFYYPVLSVVAYEPSFFSS